MVPQVYAHSIMMERLEGRWALKPTATKEPHTVLLASGWRVVASVLAMLSRSRLWEEIEGRVTDTKGIHWLGYRGVDWRGTPTLTWSQVTPTDRVLIMIE